MAYTSIIPVRRLDRAVDYVRDKTKTTRNPKSLQDAVDYALNREKTESDCFETGLSCVCETAFEDMRDMVRWWPMPWHRASAKKASSSVAPASAFPLPLIRYLVSTAPCTGIAFPPKVRGCITMKMCWIRECSSPGWGWTLWIFSLILHFLVKNVIATLLRHDLQGR